ncbi:Aldo/keto reductase [Aspergillus venezuelensis]
MSAKPKVQYRRLGNSGLRVSVPIFGCMSLGESKSMPWPVKEEEALPLLKAAYDRGVNTWDTANVYGNGASEIIIGKTLKKYSIPREKVVIMTKCFWGISEDPETLPFLAREKFETDPTNQNQFGLSRAAIFNRVNATTPMEETMEALHDLIKLSKVRYIGASSMWATQFARLQFTAEKNGWTKFVSMQNQYNLLYREEEREMNRFCHDTGVGLIPWSPLCRGHLARAPEEFGSTTRSAREKAVTEMKGVTTVSTGVSEVDVAIIRRVMELAEKKEWAMAHVALAWINKRVSSPIIGLSKIERVEQAIEAGSKVLLSEDEEKFLEELYQSKAVLVAESL